MKKLTKEQKRGAEIQLYQVAFAQTMYWNALRRLEMTLGVEIDSTLDLDDVTVDWLLKARGEADICNDCGKAVTTVIGCPDGAEICQECFDGGKH